MTERTAQSHSNEEAIRVVEIRPAARPARMRQRHWSVLASFLAIVILPILIAAGYMYGRAADQFASKVGFTVRQEEPAAEIDFLGGLSNLSGNSSTDTDILYQYIQSQQLVRLVDAELDLQTLWSLPKDDPVFTLGDNASIEDKMDFWARMVRVFYDPGTGLIEVETRAFAPGDAQAIAQSIFSHSSDVINAMSDIAREDTTRHAADELDRAINRLKDARQALTLFRNETQIVDPTVDIQGQMGLLTSLEEQLAQSLIELDLLVATTRPSDPRIAQVERRISGIEKRISEERQKLGAGAGIEGAAFANLVGQFESLQVDLEFAQQAYLTALTAYDTAVAEAQRQSRYLAAYLDPTLAETPEYPRREVILSILAMVLFGVWAILVLVFYSLRDRR